MTMEKMNVVECNKQ